MKTAYSCIVDAKPKFEWQAWLWAQSLTRHAGCPATDLKVHCLPGVSADFRRAIRALSAELIETEPFPGGHAYCNKIRQCHSHAFAGYDRIVLSDCDLFFARAPELPPRAAFAGKIVDLTNPPIEILRRIYRAADIVPSAEVLVGCPGAEHETTICTNLNGGFYLMEAALLSEIGGAWERHARWLIERIEMLECYRAHVDQVAMALALDEMGLNPVMLPPQVNFPIHLVPERLEQLPTEGIAVFHYHSSFLPGGHIKSTGVPGLDHAIAAANRQIDEILSGQFDNALFWNMRYACFPELGSGLGSRGEVLEHKKRLLSWVTGEFAVREVLDVGCGDLEAAKDLRFDHYTGRDLSFAALEIAAKQSPEWRFVQGPLPPGGPQADLVICLDVLIHQRSVEAYGELVSRLAAAAGRRLLVSGYDSMPAAASSIVFFHEPLRISLKNTGAFNEIMEIGRYRDVVLFAADKAITGPALHAWDMPIEILDAILPLASRRHLLRAVMDVSRRCLGFFSRTPTRALEYPWVLEKCLDLPAGARVLDIGTGVSPLPVMLGELGLRVDCVDRHPTVREPLARAEWNEWGFLDYGVLWPGIRAHHVDILEFEPDGSFDLVYSVSVVEHMPRPIWERTLAAAADWLKPGGRLLLSMDIIPGSDDLWIMNEGRKVESRGVHGTLADVRAALQRAGLSVEEWEMIRGVPCSRTDLLLAAACKR